MKRARSDWRGVWLWVLGVLAPAAVAMEYVRRFGANVPVHDEWNFMPTLGAFFAGGDWWPMVLEHYGEHRVVVPKLVILWLAQLTRYDVVVESYLSAALMGLTAWLCWLLLRRDPSTPRWAIVPIGWLVVSVAQYENLLVGWQFQISLANFLAVLAVYLASGERPWRGLPAAASAALATFSFAHGMLAWPAALLAAACGERRTRVRTAMILVGAAILSVTAYRWGYAGFARPPKGYLLAAFEKPLDAARMFVALYGNNFGEGRIAGSLGAGVLLLLLTVTLAVGLWRLRLWRRADVPWIALWLFSTTSVLAVVLGRGFTWQHFVTPSRYLTLAVFIPVVLLVLLVRLGEELWRAGGKARAAVMSVALLLGSLAMIQGISTARLGWRMGQTTFGFKQNVLLPCLLDFRSASESCLRGLYAASGELVRERAVILERWRLGPFAAPRPSPRIEESKQREASPTAAQPSLGDIQGSVDAVGPRNGQGRQLPVRRGERARAVGWALGKMLEAPVSVLLMVDGKQVGETADLRPRGDVGGYFGRPVPPCGWEISFETRELGVGEHRVRAMARMAVGEDPKWVPGERILTVAAP